MYSKAEGNGNIVSGKLELLTKGKWEMQYAYILFEIFTRLYYCSNLGRKRVVVHTKGYTECDNCCNVYHK